MMLCRFCLTKLDQDLMCTMCGKLATVETFDDDNTEGEDD